ncbi:hypothetical protein [Hymenobacter sp. 102]|uniref:hypothetical protein n=1 Tax=Hymenobacter sp. 102 TaxID=3403152 RepID=UPI003CF31E31
MLASPARAQTPGTRTLILSPLVGEVIDGREKSRYGLFPAISANDFQEARFEQSLSADSAVTLYLQLRDGRMLLQAYRPADLASLRQQISQREQELAAPASGTVPADSAGWQYRVTLRSGSTFDGELLRRLPGHLEFKTKDLGTVQVERTNVARLEVLTQQLAGRPAGWHDIGSGNRLFFAPTARNLRKGEGTLQVISLYALGVNYGFTDYFSMGALVSVVPGIPLGDQLLALTPKLSARLSDQWHVGAGAMYLRVPSDYSNKPGYGVGILYGVATYGSAENNFTMGLGYGFAGREMGRTPLLQIGGQTRISRRVSLISENYFTTDADAGVFGLYGAKINWRRTSLGLAGIYALPYEGQGFSSYIIPLYIDFTYRFGRASR